MKRPFVFVLLCCLAALPASGDTTVCYEEEFISGVECVPDWQSIIWCYPVYQLMEVCNVVSTPDPTPAPDPGPIPPPNPTPSLPTVTWSWVDTTDPSRPVTAVYVSADLSACSTVELSLDGGTVGSSPCSGSGNYQFVLPDIGAIGEGTHTMAASACDSYGGCGSASASLYRTTNRASASSDILAVWQEPDEGGAVAYSTTFGHRWNQAYTATGFSVSEVGENSRRQLRDGIVTLATTSPWAPDFWQVTIRPTGTLTHSDYGGIECANPYSCGLGTKCWSKCVTASDFGYLLSADENVFGIEIDGYSTGLTNTSLSLSFP